MENNEPGSRKALKVDREQVKQLALSIGIDAAAAQYGINPVTIRSWAHRFGWILTPVKANKEVAKARQFLNQTPPVVIATSATVKTETATMSSEKALVQHLSECKNSVHRDLSTALRKGAKAASEMEGGDVVAAARKINDLATASSRVLGIGSDSNTGPMVNVNILSMGLEGMIESGGPVIDVTPSH